MSDAPVPLKVRGFGQTLPRDTWWFEPTITFIVFASFLVYAHWVVLTQHDYYYLAKGGANYLSPFYSPLMFDSNPRGEKSGHAWFDHRLSFLPSWVTPAALILIFPAGFRFTCYYYRGAYYKAFWMDPPSCAVGEPSFRGEKYRGEAKLPLILQNIHRYFFYFAAIFIVILSYDAIISYKFYDDATRTHWKFGIGVGSLVLTANAILLASYTFGCHSLRHLICGVRDVMTGTPIRHKIYSCVSCLNRKHMLFAWMSLIWVGFTDVYVRMCAMGIWTDFRLL